MNAENSVTDERAVLHHPSGASSSTSGTRGVSGTLASARHKPCGGTQCGVAITECHQVVETYLVARCVDLILAFWFGPAMAVNFGPPVRVLATLRGWGNGSVAG